MTESADPPTMKGAGRLDSGHGGGDILGLAFVALVFGLLAAGPMLQAVLVSQGRGARGIGLNAAASTTALLLILGATAVSAGGLSWRSYYVVDVLGWGVVWLFLAALAATIGRVLRPPSRIKPQA